MERQRSETTGPRPTEQKLFHVWAAGYLDGEGCFSYASTPRINVSNTYPWSLLALQEAYGGTVAVKTDRREGPRPQFEWNCYGQNTLHCVNLILPHLFEKRRQAEILREMRTYPARSAMRGALRTELKALKRIRYE